MASLDERGPGLIGITSGQARRDAQRNGQNAESYATELTQNARLNHDVLPPLPAFDRQGRGRNQPRGDALISCEAAQRSTRIFTTRLKSETGRLRGGGGL